MEIQETTKRIQNLEKEKEEAMKRASTNMDDDSLENKNSNINSRSDWNLHSGISS